MASVERYKLLIATSAHNVFLAEVVTVHVHCTDTQYLGTRRRRHACIVHVIDLELVSAEESQAIFLAVFTLP